MKTSVPSMRKARWPAAWPGVKRASTSRAAGVELLAVAEDDLDLVVELGRAGLMGNQRRVAELRPRLGEAGDVIAVRVGDEDMGDLDPVPLGPLQRSGPEVVVAVDQDAGAAVRMATR